MLIALLCFVDLAISDVTAIDEGAPAPYGGLLFNDESSGKLLLDVQRLPFLEDSWRNLEEQVATYKKTEGVSGDKEKNLLQQIDLLKQQLQIEKERTALERERGQFYKEKFDQSMLINKQHEALEEKLLKEAESKTFWKSLAIGELLLMIGLFVGLAL